MTEEFEPQAAFAELITRTRFADLPPAVIDKAKVFLLDSLGVGLAGSSTGWAAPLVDAVGGWGQAPEARCWRDGRRLPAPSAALLNAAFTHGLEFDCVHEGAVVHPMATAVSVALAHAERRPPVSGPTLITALSLAADVAASLGLAARAPMRFFRPGTASAFGATAALASLAEMDHATTMNALGMVYGQVSGTLQPHAEGSVLLPMQMGFSARAALCAADLAMAGFAGPHQSILGPYGYLRLFEDGFDLAPIRAVTGGDPERPWRIAELSHKPYPSGRLTHGVVDGLARLQAAHGFASADVARVRVMVPSLVARLTARPLPPAPDENYARLCLPFVAGVQLARGRVEIGDFRGAALTDPMVHAHARRIEVVADEALDANAITPQTVEVTLHDGHSHAITLEHVLGHPEAPLTRAEHLDKFRRCCASAARPLDAGAVDALIAMVDEIERLDDVRALVDVMLGAAR